MVVQTVVLADKQCRIPRGLGVVVVEISSTTLEMSSEGCRSFMLSVGDKDKVIDKMQRLQSHLGDKNPGRFK